MKVTNLIKDTSRKVIFSMDSRFSADSNPIQDRWP